jgi:hypothetical protein
MEFCKIGPRAKFLTLSTSTPFRRASRVDDFDSDGRLRYRSPSVELMRRRFEGASPTAAVKTSVEVTALSPVSVRQMVRSYNSRCGFKARFLKQNTAPELAKTDLCLVIYLAPT